MGCSRLNPVESPRNGGFRSRLRAPVGRPRVTPPAPGLALFGCLLACLAAGLLGASGAQAARGLTTGFADTILDEPDAATRDFWFKRAVKADAGLVMFYTSWRGITGNRRPASPADPADPAYNFAELDAAVRDASGRGLDVVIAATYAPEWAEGSGRPQSVLPGAWKPDPAALGQFAQALAARYSGLFTPPRGERLPRVEYFQPWSEPNLTGALAPQYENGRPSSPELYRRLLNSFYDGVDSVNPRAKVVAAGTAPYGDPKSTNSLAPVRFWRDVLCLHDRKRLLPTACPQPAKLDVFAHNAITYPGGPTRRAALADNAATADFGKLRRVVRAAERHGTVLPAKGRRPLWATEMWWDSNPPDRKYGVPLARHARWIEQALYILWKNGASVAVNLKVGDDGKGDFGFDDTHQSGLYFRNGKPKPALRAFRFPFVAERKGKRAIAWGKAPKSGKLVIQRRAAGGWRGVGSKRVRAGDVFKRRLGRGAKGTLRARIGSTKSLTWRLR